MTGHGSGHRMPCQRKKRPGGAVTLTTRRIRRVGTNPTQPQNKTKRHARAPTLQAHTRDQGRGGRAGTETNTRLKAGGVVGGHTQRSGGSTHAQCRNLAASFFPHRFELTELRRTRHDAEPAPQNKIDRHNRRYVTQCSHNCAEKITPALRVNCHVRFAQERVGDRFLGAASGQPVDWFCLHFAPTAALGLFQRSLSPLCGFPALVVPLPSHHRHPDTIPCRL